MILSYLRIYRISAQIINFNFIVTILSAEVKLWNWRIDNIPVRVIFFQKIVQKINLHEETCTFSLKYILFN